eukprot:GILI01023308.1.p2 GENE.GILI01023308.1~~GILI01023308.1.p2  ORF type:complete len:194 (-),score=29.79 GILI01023308.1:22-603(-)
MSCQDCRGLGTMNVWCDDNPCNIGRVVNGRRCECQARGGAVAGIVVACVALCMIPILICLCCRFMQRRKQHQQMQGTTPAAAGVSAYDPNANHNNYPYANGSQQQQQQAVYGSPYGANQQQYAYGVPQQSYTSQPPAQGYGYGTPPPATNQGYGAPPPAQSDVPPFANQSSNQPSYEAEPGANRSHEGPVKRV